MPSVVSYFDLIDDVWALAPPASPGASVRQQHPSDRVLRAIWHALIELVNEVAEVNATWPLLPRSKATIDLTADAVDLAAGVAIGAAHEVASIAYVAGIDSIDRRIPVSLLHERQRDGVGNPGFRPPAAFVAGSEIRPIPRPGTPWTHESIRSFGWQPVETLMVEYVQLIARPNDVNELVPVDIRFTRPAVRKAAADLYANRTFRLDYEHEKTRLRGQAGRGPAVNQQVRTTQEVL